ncbi:type II toxin-antitoxin system Phd/YefM family antitoxin [Pistricoccus aurantiacus]|uniref:Type II toxin-antitoxin system Phd/YefM family antitoxin n=1 Tax=Pistricoccus aurantiacus TaxID=1883414 RepID=A0A5B8SRR4_9GAMM|nr:type II toxin-antitoxin system Phd/YefM family antitoxin [Pistricoccus aurantiacus]
MRSEEISKTQFKARALEILRQIEASGEPVIVTDKGRPAIEVRRYRSDQRLPLERLRGSVLKLVGPFEPAGDGDWEALKSAPRRAG